jgi:hypothetical protein
MSTALSDADTAATITTRALMRDSSVIVRTPGSHRQSQQLLMATSLFTRLTCEER